MPVSYEDVCAFQKKINEMKIRNDNRIPKSPNVLMLLKWYAKEIEWADEQINQLEKQFAFYSVCAKGCSFCCSQSVPILYSEALIIQKEIGKFDISTRSRLLKKTEYACSVLEENGLSDLSARAMSNNEAILKEKYYALNITCPLINENGECIIYPVRPIACCNYRCYNSSTDCKNTCTVDTALTFDGIIMFLYNRLSRARKQKEYCKFIPLALKDALLNKL